MHASQHVPGQMEPPNHRFSCLSLLLSPDVWSVEWEDGMALPLACPRDVVNGCDGPGLAEHTVRHPVAELDNEGRPIRTARAKAGGVPAVVHPSAHPNSGNRKAPTNTMRWASTIRGGRGPSWVGDEVGTVGTYANGAAFAAVPLVPFRRLPAPGLPPRASPVLRFRRRVSRRRGLSFLSCPLLARRERLGTPAAKAR